MTVLDRVLITCEHATSRVPPEYARAFAGRAWLLRTHRGHDPGALPLARFVARAIGTRVIATTFTRLLADPNRTIGNPDMWSVISRGFPAAERELIVRRFVRPHVERVAAAIHAAVARRHTILHLGVHTFTPVWHGVRREVDIGVLFDPGRTAERAVGRSLTACMRTRLPRLRVLPNQPYTGADDGLTTYFRTVFPAELYLGVELEVNQRLWRARCGGTRAGRRTWNDVSRAVAETVAAVRAGVPALGRGGGP